MIWGYCSSVIFLYFWSNEEQLLIGYPIDSSSGGGQVQKLSVVCLHKSYCCERHPGLLHCGTPEPCLSAIYIVSSVGTSFEWVVRCNWINRYHAFQLYLKIFILIDNNRQIFFQHNLWPMSIFSLTCFYLDLAVLFLMRMWQKFGILKIVLSSTKRTEEQRGPVCSNKSRIWKNGYRNHRVMFTMCSSISLILSW